jgi:oxygen-independent coproporphyrinogen III oxidase
MKLGIYIQVPFCQTKCTYCNFHTGVFPKGLHSPYVGAVCKELGGVKLNWPQTVDTVYIGGGTPSLLEPSALGRIIDAIRGNFCCALEEVTLEADPETITEEKARAWRDAGIDRISMGAQSFVDGELKAAGRMHRREDIFNAVECLRAAGGKRASAGQAAGEREPDPKLELGSGNISLDLIAGLPHQTAASWNESIDQIMRIRPEHISIYMMEIDEGSRLGREVLAGGTRYSARELPSDDAMAEFYERACERLALEGYEHYEISNWALPGFRSRHNLKYWRREPYLGVGAGAHSYDGRRRWANVHDPAAYVAGIEQGRTTTEQDETVTDQQALEEELFLGLRQLEGIDLRRIEERYGVKLQDRIQVLAQQGLIECEGDTIRLAPAKLTVSNEAFVALLGQ